jgi:AcrR family transcriptional regulator
MSMPSGLSKLKRRVPQQDRGERRVAEVLQAAAAVIADVGYEAATMTAVAERAGASIGALYQYFPNKEAIARALRRQYTEEMQARWAPLAGQGAQLSVAELVDRILEVVIYFMENRPAYIPLMSAPKTLKDPAAGIRLRELFAGIYRERQGKLTPEVAFRIANVTVQTIKGMNALYAEARPAERVEIVREFKLMLTSYLTGRLAL